MYVEYIVHFITVLFFAPPPTRAYEPARASRAYKSCEATVNYIYRVEPPLASIQALIRLGILSQYGFPIAHELPSRSHCGPCLFHVSLSDYILHSS